ncbi:hypothetical protein CKY02_23090 [Photorhabdus bodei]|uniref:Toxin SymE-like domain-containing protein n=1 Tax=Photorhabdus bodei TaxID=2029681 RepID=A0A329WKQ9_9GAMM|nr:SymE family type I addiction module toxin [Photorhabdus bodei]RAX05211.1 hypothetical protein CKY02_23090 [Photorhabdus bodei]
MKTERYYTVGYVPNGNRVNNATPAIHLKGQWLRQAGFNTCLSYTNILTRPLVIELLPHRLIPIKNTT